MANTIQIKRSSTASATPSAGQLSAGELAINTADGRLFAKNSGGNVINLPVSSISGQAITPSSVSATGNVSGSTLTSTVAVGTAPLTITSTTVCANLNADTVDGNHASAFATASHTHSAADVTSGTLANARLPSANRLSSYCAGILFG